MLPSARILKYSFEVISYNVVSQESCKRKNTAFQFTLNHAPMRLDGGPVRVPFVYGAFSRTILLLCLPGDTILFTSSLFRIRAFSSDKIILDKALSRRRCFQLALLWRDFVCRICSAGKTPKESRFDLRESPRIQRSAAIMVRGTGAWRYEWHPGSRCLLPAAA